MRSDRTAQDGLRGNRYTAPAAGRHGMPAPERRRLGAAPWLNGRRHQRGPALVGNNVRLPHRARRGRAPLTARCEDVVGGPGAKQRSTSQAADGLPLGAGRQHRRWRSAGDALSRNSVSAPSRAPRAA